MGTVVADSTETRKSCDEKHGLNTKTRALMDDPDLAANAAVSGDRSNRERD